ncbi:MAG: hypothetical protein CMC28_03985 [Flavobacteriaceae bacterium]|mgnify:CR=1 FL=1|nr:hypothetical protein [Flavobacteriaceae bacterium]
MKKNNSNIDHKKNVESKSLIIEKLKNLITEDSTIKIKYKIFNQLKKSWTEIGKTPGHLSFGLNNTYRHHIKVFYDFLYLDKDFKKKDLESNKKLKKEIIENSKKIENSADKLKAYRELLTLIKKWNYQIGPVEPKIEESLNNEFDNIIKKIKESKKDYLKNKEEFDEKNILKKKEILENFKNLTKEYPKEKNEWLKLINQIKALKEEFMNIGPIKGNENNEIWKSFKNINRDFSKEKNLFFKNLKKDYSDNINKQLEILRELENYVKTNVIDKKKILDYRDKFKKIKNVPFKRNRENWDKFNLLCNQSFGKIESKRSEIKKEKIEVFNKKRELLKNLNLNNIDSNIEEWKSLEYTGSIKEEKEFLTIIKKELENKNKNSDEIEIELSKIKSKILDKDSINFEKNKIIKKIEDYKKQISQLENNLTFVSQKSDTSIFSNVHSNINSFRKEIEKLEKNLDLISKS